MTFFANILTSLDKKTLSFASGIPKDELSNLSHAELRRLGIILLSNNMPRTSSFFFYKPRKNSKKIKFFNYFDCCKRLASVKANKKTTSDEFSDEMRRCSLCVTKWCWCLRPCVSSGSQKTTSRSWWTS